ncbi:MAG: twin-arginine translocase TatA/TatE family subunit [Bacteroidota bacterium]|nr:twin-arginine translocase TatA/TatE family subunit [Bacteroidota bacterium]MDE2835570.1 twin-arginine translocase TatA/TatE family subunit [Bacteroidota bacterium]MDE2957375.1 twin-arginine translocase TatA/TatE family subunit [Bacteroidota bacterium]
MLNFAIFNLGPVEIGAIMLIILLLFGAKRIPEIARGLGKGIREFKSATSDISRELTLEERRTAYRPPSQETTYARPPQSDTSGSQPGAAPQGSAGSS